MNDSPVLRPVHTLYADDVPANRRYLQAMLNKLGLQTDVAADGSSALALWEQARHPLVLLDVRMPGMDGEEVAGRIRELQSPQEHVVILGISAEMNDELREELQRAGMDDCITKPTNAEALQAALAPWLGGSGSAQTRAEGSVLHQDPALVTQLMEELPQDVAALQVAHASGDRQRLRGLAHQISGIAALYQLPRLRGAVDALQENLKADAAVNDDAIQAVTNAMAEDLVELQSGL